MHRLFLLFAFVGLLSSALYAQTPNPWPPRTRYGFHVYVDPTFGDDLKALAWNPVWGGTPAPLTRHPDITAIPAADAAADPTLGQFIGGVLTQAPYSFRTVNAAIQYVCTAGPAVNSHWLLGANLGNAYIKWIIIHLLPGIYRASQQATLDPACGLPWNGEVSPSKCLTASACREPPPSTRSSTPPRPTAAGLMASKSCIQANPRSYPPSEHGSIRQASHR